MAGQEPVLPLTTADLTASPPHTATATANASSATSISSKAGGNGNSDSTKLPQDHQQQQQQPTTTSNDDDDENVAPKTSSSPTPPTFLSTLSHEIDKAYADIPVCICSFVSGLCDSVVFSAAAVFVSMQTGNTVFLALGAAYLPTHVPFMWLRALSSIGAFLLGAFTFGQLRRFKPTCKLTLSLNFLAQSLMIFAAAALAQSGAVPELADLHLAEEMAVNGEIDLLVLVPIVLLAFQFGGQIVSSRQLGFNEVPTNVLTSVYCDLMSDPLLFSGLHENPKRNRRASAVVLMFVGAVMGGWLGRAAGTTGMAAALWIGGGVKFVIAVSWLCWATKAPVKKNIEETAVVSEKK
ncbi:uncharacterized protein B0I36DRAFT_329124 [Microdochium trichocladiopsis]|uniref:DUF1275 domain protein n=1 Tax=Microdochium trichocladiopsis TaxID=1682393 RepID=A0A9P9BQE3_9PEZI|nr:uncharacterized protein B0I36DRAFT_329124 [Microdochium trichocladiopsis]KAH7025782.1 hypothetical protein B0I36DRAFT_329124 [Microdochium trichocladiopsis]